MLPTTALWRGSHIEPLQPGDFLLSHNSFNRFFISTLWCFHTNKITEEYLAQHNKQWRPVCPKSYKTNSWRNTEAKVEIEWLMYCVTHQLPFQELIYVGPLLTREIEEDQRKRGEKQWRQRWSIKVGLGTAYKSLLNIEINEGHWLELYVMNSISRIK